MYFILHCHQCSCTVDLDLHSNKLSGTIPNAINLAENLALVDFSDNVFSGTIPEQMFDLGNLEFVYLQGNSLHGSIDSSSCFNKRIWSDCVAEVSCSCCTKCF